MYRKKDNQKTIDDFLVPFGGHLLADNRWVIKANMIPWDESEGDYAYLFPSGTGTVAKPARVAFGALIIKETLGLTDEETVEQIRENPYLQCIRHEGNKGWLQSKRLNATLIATVTKRNRSTSTCSTMLAITSGIVEQTAFA